MKESFLLKMMEWQAHMTIHCVNAMSPNAPAAERAAACKSIQEMLKDIRAAYKNQVEREVAESIVS